MRTHLLLLLWLLHSVTCAAQTSTAVQRPFLWTVKVDGESGSAWKAHLFGTIHVPDPILTKLHADVQQAWDNCTAAFFEIDFLKDSAAQTTAISLPAGEQLEDLVPKELLDRLDARLRKISPTMTRQVLPKLRVAIWPLLLGNLEAQARHLNRLPMDLKMYSEARRAGKTVGGLEKPGEQLIAVRELSMSDQVEFLAASLNAMDADDRNGVHRLELTKNLYVNGDESDFGRFLDDEFSRAKLKPDLLTTVRRSLLYDRNRTMAKEIERLIEASPDERFFFAVGIGHLVGRQTIPSILRERGFQVRRVNPTNTAITAE